MPPVIGVLTPVVGRPDADVDLGVALFGEGPRLAGPDICGPGIPGAPVFALMCTPDLMPAVLGVVATSPTPIPSFWVTSKGAWKFE
mmetsp:Transcript_5135/g.5932  ORF Transcript_5135/g.5932 Transcript_5135/m.5932 type:complete len:86 (+) Transcript_5135:1040-1297(+)